jgi:hypothetical protein
MEMWSSDRMFQDHVMPVSDGHRLPMTAIESDYPATSGGLNSYFPSELRVDFQIFPSEWRKFSWLS